MRYNLLSEVELKHFFISVKTAYEIHCQFLKLLKSETGMQTYTASTNQQSKIMYSRGKYNNMQCTAYICTHKVGINLAVQKE